MARRGITEKRFTCINAMPEAGLKAMFTKSKLNEIMEPKKGTAFEIRFRIGIQGDREEIFLAPGESIELRDTEAVEFKQRCLELGGIIVPVDISTDEERDYITLKAAVAVTRARLNFFRSVGKSKIVELMGDANPPRRYQVDLDTFRADYWPYLINEERAAVLKKALEKLVPQLEKAEAAWNAAQSA